MARTKSICVGRKMKKCKNTKKYCKWASGKKRKYCYKRRTYKKKA